MDVDQFNYRCNEHRMLQGTMTKIILLLGVLAAAVAARAGQMKVAIHVPSTDVKKDMAPVTFASTDELLALPELKNEAKDVKFVKFSVSRQNLTPSGQQVLMAEFNDGSCKPVGLLESATLPELGDWTGPKKGAPAEPASAEAAAPP